MAPPTDVCAERAPGQRRHIGSRDKLADGEMCALELPGLPKIALFRQAGRYHATEDTCTHARASLSEGWLDGERVACPVHGAEFCIRTGAALSFPATRALQVFEVIEDGDELYLLADQAEG